MQNIKTIIGIYLIVINLISFILFFLDKKKALKYKWRIKESTLHLSSFLGGSLGSIIAMKLFHHKTKKTKFRLITILAFIFNLFVIGAFFFDYKSILNNIL